MQGVGFRVRTTRTSNSSLQSSTAVSCKYEHIDPHQQGHMGLLAGGETTGEEEVGEA